MKFEKLVGIIGIKRKLSKMVRASSPRPQHRRTLGFFLLYCSSYALFPSELFLCLCVSFTSLPFFLSLFPSPSSYPLSCSSHSIDPNCYIIVESMRPGKLKHMPILVLSLNFSALLVSYSHNLNLSSIITILSLALRPDNTHVNSFQAQSYRMPLLLQNLTWPSVFYCRSLQNRVQRDSFGFKRKHSNAYLLMFF